MVVIVNNYATFIQYSGDNGTLLKWFIQVSVGHLCQMLVVLKVVML